MPEIGAGTSFGAGFEAPIALTRAFSGRIGDSAPPLITYFLEAFATVGDNIDESEGSVNILAAYSIRMSLLVVPWALFSGG
jgi:hypothetical protein